jgi:hypothetical protein
MRTQVQRQDAKTPSKAKSKLLSFEIKRISWCLGVLALEVGFGSLNG